MKSRMTANISRYRTNKETGSSAPSAWSRKTLNCCSRRSADRRTDFAVSPGTRYVKILSYPIAVRGKRYSVQTGMALNKSKVLVANFSQQSSAADADCDFARGSGGHFMSRKALKPILNWPKKRGISRSPFDIRLPVPDARDEVSDLSRTLNQMPGAN